MCGKNTKQGHKSKQCAQSIAYFLQNENKNAKRRREMEREKHQMKQKWK